MKYEINTEGVKLTAYQQKKEYQSSISQMILEEGIIKSLQLIDNQYIRDI